MAIIKFTRVADKHESSLQQQQRAAQIGLASSQQGALALQAALTAVKLGDAAMDSRPLNAAIKGMGRLFGSEQSSEELAKEKRARALRAMEEQGGDSGATGTTGAPADAPEVSSTPAHLLTVDTPADPREGVRVAPADAAATVEGMSRHPRDSGTGLQRGAMKLQALGSWLGSMVPSTDTPEATPAPRAAPAQAAAAADPRGRQALQSDDLGDYGEVEGKMVAASVRRQIDFDARERVQTVPLFGKNRDLVDVATRIMERQMENVPIPSYAELKKKGSADIAFLASSAPRSEEDMAILMALAREASHGKDLYSMMAGDHEEVAALDIMARQKAHRDGVDRETAFKMGESLAKMEKLQATATERRAMATRRMTEAEIMVDGFAAVDAKNWSAAYLALERGRWTSTRLSALAKKLARTGGGRRYRDPIWSKMQPTAAEDRLLLFNSKGKKVTGGAGTHSFLDLVETRFGPKMGEYTKLRTAADRELNLAHSVKKHTLAKEKHEHSKATEERKQQRYQNEAATDAWEREVDVLFDEEKTLLRVPKRETGLNRRTRLERLDAVRGRRETLQKAGPGVVVQAPPAPKPEVGGRVNKGKTEKGKTDESAGETALKLFKPKK
tara:strand:+ start:5472 stop:7316 length:1845 start_codon:yes stop_codon:yes gene_type:complete